MDMPMKKKRTVAAQAAARGPLPELPKALLDDLVKGHMTRAEVQDLMLAFNKAVIERAMGAEMNLHLGYPRGQSKPAARAPRTSNGHCRRSVPVHRNRRAAPAAGGSLAAAAGGVPTDRHPSSGA
ncbi:hypothetical protein QFZ89_001624 [Paraburkholderia youngii]